MGSQSDGRSVAFTEMTKNLIYEKKMYRTKSGQRGEWFCGIFFKPRAKRTKETK
jgi:hypothetical protein